MATVETNTATKQRGQMSSEEKIAADLGWPVKAVAARLKFLGLFDVCTRCHGVGHYSYNPINGTTCFRCGGTRETLPKWSKSLIVKAKEMIDSGALVPYFERLDRIRAAKLALRPALKSAEEAYYRIANEYELAYKANAVNAELLSKQRAANNLYWADMYTSNHGTTERDIRSCCIFPSVTEIERMAKRGELDAEMALAMVYDRTARLDSIA